MKEKRRESEGKKEVGNGGKRKDLREYKGKEKETREA